MNAMTKNKKPQLQIPPSVAAPSVTAPTPNRVLEPDAFGGRRGKVTLTIPVAVPSEPPNVRYQSSVLANISRLTPLQKQGMLLFTNGVISANVTLEGGHVVRDNTNAFRWFLERIALADGNADGNQ